MAIPSNINTRIAYGAETTFGTQSSAAGQLIRRIQSSLALQKDIVRSNEVDPVQQVRDARHGSRRVTGSISGHLSKTTYDDFLAAVLRGSWVSDELVPGLLYPSFTIDQYYADTDVSKTFLGCRLGGFSLSIKPNANADISFDIQGQDMTYNSGSGAPAFATPTATSSTGLLSAISGTVSVDGVASTVITGMDIQVTNGLNTQPVIGSTKVPDIWYGMMEVTGSITAFFDSPALLNAYLNETIVKFSVTLTGSDSTSMQFHMNKCKVNGHTDTIGAEGGVIATIPFQSFYATGISGDASGSLVIERA